MSNLVKSRFYQKGDANKWVQGTEHLVQTKGFYQLRNTVIATAMGEVKKGRFYEAVKENQPPIEDNHNELRKKKKKKICGSNHCVTGHDDTRL